MPTARGLPQTLGVTRERRSCPEQMQCKRPRVSPTSLRRQQQGRGCAVLRQRRWSNQSSGQLSRSARAVRPSAAGEPALVHHQFSAKGWFGSCSRQVTHHARALVSQRRFSAHHRARARALQVFLQRLAPAARPSAVSAPSSQLVAFNSEPIQSTVVPCKRRLRFSTMATPNHSVKPTCLRHAAYLKR